MTRPTLLCDVDDVLFDFTGKVLHFLNLRFGHEFTHDDCRGTFKLRDSLELTNEEWAETTAFIKSPGFALSGTPLEGCLELSNMLNKGDCPFDVHFVTSPWWSSRTWMGDRAEWLRGYFGQKQARSIAFTSEKWRVDGDVFVDDKPSAVRAWTAAKELRAGLGRPWAGFTWSQPWNEHDRTQPWVRDFSVIAHFVREAWHVGA